MHYRSRIKGFFRWLLDSRLLCGVRNASDELRTSLSQSESHFDLVYVFTQRSLLEVAANTLSKERIVLIVSVTSNYC